MPRPSAQDLVAADSNADGQEWLVFFPMHISPSYTMNHFMVPDYRTQLFLFFILNFFGKIGYQKPSGQGSLIKYPL